MNNSGAAVEVIKDRNGTDQFCFGIVEEHLQGLKNSLRCLIPVSNCNLGLNSVLCLNLFRLACMEDRSFVVRPRTTCHLSHFCVVGNFQATVRFEEGYRYFPQFGQRGSLEQHGRWESSLISRIRNINCKPFSFSIAYHTYFSISDISEVRVEGLETLDYLDNLCQRERFTEQGDALTFESEVDRVYLGSRDVIAIFDHEQKRTFFIRKEGLPDIGVWNPWEKKSRAMVDFGDENTSRCFVSMGQQLKNQ
ncbi:putative glucose-6-phosphate 1-epimerase [Hibiscus syriacus]|uniref:Glucose-6-phosphate 1-epimerase n=1 Tax=Hibiscus syriacus TaxID=106335 RepID=A0A6A2WH62_HIBSY|nr:putative glucose-6-phosphate 1-epimerase [Hibiscus syriacus]